MPRKKQRIAQLDREIDEDIVTQLPLEALQSKLDEDLFVIDQKGSSASKQRIQKQEFKKTSIPKGEQKKISKILLKKAVDVGASNANLSSVYDMWSMNNSTHSDTNTKTSASTRSRITKSVPLSATVLPGMSYNPSKEDHGKVVIKAVEIESKKIEKEDREKQIALVYSQNSIVSVARPFSDVFDDLEGPAILEEDDDDEDSDDDEEDDEDDETDKKKKRLKSKITKSERNRKREHKERTFLENQTRKEKTLLKSIGTATTLVKGISKIQKLKSTKKLEAEKRKLETEVKQKDRLLNMSYDDAGQVPLSDELGGSLRTMIPKGNRAKDLMKWKIEKGDMLQKGARKRRAYEKPHAKKKIKWISSIKHRETE